MAEESMIAPGISFLRGGGEMGELTRSYDWSDTVLGTPDSWPQSLRTTLSIILNSRFPMFLFWGPELICFYNDAYRPSLGKDGKHPHALGKPAEEVWGEIWDAIKPLIDQVLAGGEATWSEDQLLPIYRNGKLEDVYWTFSYSPVNDESGTPAGVFVTCTETTDKVLTLKKLEESNDQLAFAIDSAELGTFDLNPATNSFVANDRMRNWFGIQGQEIELSSALKVIAPYDRQRVEDAIAQALDYSTGGFFDIVYTLISADGQSERVVRAKGRAWFNSKNEAYRFNGTLMDLTEAVQARMKVQESDRRMRLIIAEAPISIGIFKGPDYVVEIANNRALELWGRTEEQVMNKPILEVMPELIPQGIKALLDDVYLNGRPFSATELPVQLMRRGQMETAYVNFSYQPLYVGEGQIDGIMAVGVEVTDQVLAHKKIEANEEKLSIVIEASELGMWEIDLRTRAITSSPRFREILGLSDNETLTLDDTRRQLHPDDVDRREESYRRAYETGILEFTGRIYWPDGSLHWVQSKGKVFFDVQNLPYYLVGTIRDFTDEKMQQEVLLKNEEKFRLLADSMPQHIWTSDTEGNLNYFNQSVFSYSGLTPEDISRDGWIQIVHPDDRDENIREWMKSITNGTDFNFEHRFRRHDGEYRWQLSRAIPQRDAAGNIQMWVGTSTDIQDNKMFTDELEEQVYARTLELEEKNIELVHMNAELQSFAYVSSHDLQEPLRKIQTFSSLVVDKEEQNLSELGKDYFRRMREAANRMQRLIEDLLAYSRTSSIDRVFEQTDLNKIVSDVLYTLKEKIDEKQAKVVASELPHLKVIPFQFNQLLQNIISNALKFSDPARPPVITISSEEVAAKATGIPRLGTTGNYIHITITDNGIGFEPEYKDRIFEVFQKLHGSSEFHGTGIGLAIVKKIVEHHGGHISASGALNEGATFNIYLPVE